MNDKKEDNVNHPKHYTFGKFEVIDVLQDWFPNNPLLWQVAKYIARAKQKGNYLEDLKKARFYLDREITNNESSKSDDRFCNFCEHGIEGGEFYPDTFNGQYLHKDCQAVIARQPQIFCTGSDLACRKIVTFWDDYVIIKGGIVHRSCITQR